MTNNNEGSHSEYFEELCALAASGQISELEFVELRDHLQGCTECRSSYGEFIDLVHYKLPLADPELKGSTMLTAVSSEASSYRERFLTRARKQGLAVSTGVLQDIPGRRKGSWLFPRLDYAQIAAASIAVLVVTSGILGYGWRESIARNQALSLQLAEMANQINRQVQPERSMVTSTPPGTMPSPPATALKPAVVSPPVVGTSAELDQLRNQFEVAESRANSLHEELLKANSEISDARKETSDAKTQLKKEQEKAKQEMDQIRSQYASNLANKDSDVQRLQKLLNARSVTLERQTTLLAGPPDIFDLIASRNFHVIDVYDVDSKGKQSPGFGRIAYMENASLTYYAYDLDNRVNAKQKVFQVWGTGGPGKNAARSLGFLSLDDQKQNRWKYKSENPAILAEIDSVFVTVENLGGSVRPTGDRLLNSAFKTNHR